MGLRSAWLALVPFLLGVALLADAFRRGAATVSVVVVVPIITSTSAEFALGVLLVFAAAFLAAALAASGTAGWESRTPLEATSESSVASGGVLLIGPVPIFWGSARRTSRRTRLGWALVGLGLTIAAVALFWFAR